MTALFAKTIFRIAATARPAFLILTPCCLSPVVAFSLSEQPTINSWHLILILLAGIAAHVSVNMFNEYEDFKTGLDFQTHRTAFSGGSGTLPQSPELACAVYTGAMVSLFFTLLIGLYFLSQERWSILPIGVLGVLLIYFYTNQITHRPMICLIAPGMAFGPLMMCGAYMVLSGHFSWAVFSISLVVFLLVNNLLLLNQFPDLEADQNVGRLHLPILLGRQKSARVYAAFTGLAYLVLMTNVAIDYLPVYSLLGLLGLVLAIPACQIVLHHSDDIPELRMAMGLNVAMTLITPVLMAIGMVLSN